MRLFTFIILIMASTILILKKKHSGDKRITKQLDTIQFIIVMPLTLYFSTMANLNFMVSARSVFPVIILLVIKIIGSVIGYMKKNMRLVWGLGILILGDLFLIMIYFIYGIEKFY